MVCAAEGGVRKVVRGVKWWCERWYAEPIPLMIAKLNGVEIKTYCCPNSGHFLQLYGLRDLPCTVRCLVEIGWKTVEWNRGKLGLFLCWSASFFNMEKAWVRGRSWLVTFAHLVPLNENATFSVSVSFSVTSISCSIAFHHVSVHGAGLPILWFGSTKCTVWYKSIFLCIYYFTIYFSSVSDYTRTYSFLTNVWKFWSGQLLLRGIPRNGIFSPDLLVQSLGSPIWCDRMHLMFSISRTCTHTDVTWFLIWYLSYLQSKHLFICFREYIPRYLRESELPMVISPISVLKKIGEDSRKVLCRMIAN